MICEIQYFITIFKSKNDYIRLYQIVDLLLFFKYLKNVDCNFSSYFEVVGSLHRLRSSSNGTLLKLPRVKTTALQSSYFYRLVRLLNSLPRDILEASSVFSFKKYINNLYFSRLANFNINERCTWSLACSMYCHILCYIWLPSSIL